MKLLALFPGTNEQGGADNYVLTITRAAQQRGWDVHAGFPKTTVNSLAERFRSQGVRCHHIALPEDYRRFKLIREICRQMLSVASLLVRVRPNAVLIMLPWPDRCPGLVLGCGLMSVPAAVVFQLAPYPIEFSEKKLKAYARARQRRQQWVAVSNHNQRVLAEMFHVSPDELVRIYNGVSFTPTTSGRGGNSDLSTLRQSVRQELSLPENARLALTVARLKHNKGHQYLVPAIPKLAKEFPDLYFIWLGDGEERATLEKNVRNYGIEKRVLMLGQRPDVARFLKASDLFVFPTCDEGHPFALIEAMAEGLPVVTSAASGIAEIIKHGTHGLLFRPHDSCELRDTLDWALTHPAEMQAMAVNARKRVLDFSEETMVNETLALLEKLSSANSSQERSV